LKKLTIEEILLREEPGDPMILLALLLLIAKGELEAYEGDDGVVHYIRSVK